MAESIVDVLKNEHDYVKSLFSKIQVGYVKGEDISQRFNDLRFSLLEHTRSEERVLYPQLAALEDLRVLAEDAEEDHDIINDLLEDLNQEPLADPDWGQKFQMLRIDVVRHIEFEEDRIFTALHQYFLQEEMEIMGEEYRRTEGRSRQIENLKNVAYMLRKRVQGTLGRIFS